MESKSNSDFLLDTFRAIMVALAAKDGRTITGRQLATFFICYWSDPPHTVRGLAADLNVRTPELLHALNANIELELATREPDHRDRRSVLVERTAKGAELFRDLRIIMDDAASAWA
jgi:DNA-binding MarR family transcriptional regulator